MNPRLAPIASCLFLFCPSAPLFRCFDRPPPGVAAPAPAAWPWRSVAATHVAQMAWALGHAAQVLEKAFRLLENALDSGGLALKSAFRLRAKNALDSGGPHPLGERPFGDRLWPPSDRRARLVDHRLEHTTQPSIRRS